MAGPRTIYEWAPIVGLVAAWLLLTLWLKRSQNARAASEGKTDELKRRRALAFAWGLIGAGVVLSAVVVASLRNLPPGNEPVAASMVITGAVCVLFGVYRLYRVGK
jgi:FtsH-binding integral membrane protein